MEPIGGRPRIIGVPALKRTSSSVRNRIQNSFNRVLVFRR
jgi:hypothetical protein